MRARQEDSCGAACSLEAADCSERGHSCLRVLTQGAQSHKVVGPSSLVAQGGIYHGRILLPPEYPFKPPSFMMLTQNGRFETGVKICLSISSHHPEHWQPSWSVRTALTALIAFMPTPGNGAIGSMVSAWLCRLLVALRAGSAAGVVLGRTRKAGCRTVWHSATCSCASTLEAHLCLGLSQDYTKEERKSLARKSRLGPPSFGSAERQKVSQELHETMIAAEQQVSMAACGLQRIIVAVHRGKFATVQ